MNKNNQIETEAQLKVVLESVEEYYRANACTTTATSKEKSITINQLLTGAIGITTHNLKEAKEE